MAVIRHETHSWATEIGMWFCNVCWASAMIPSFINHDLGCPNGCLDANGEPFSEAHARRLEEVAHAD